MAPDNFPEANRFVVAVVMTASMFEEKRNNIIAAGMDDLSASTIGQRIFLTA